MLDLIDDGYTIRARIKAVKGQNNQLDFEYRPLVGDEGEQKNKAINAAADGEQPNLKAELIVERLSSWSAKQRDGEPAPIAVATVSRLPTHVFFSLYMIILGFLSPDCELDANGNEVKPSTPGGNAKN
jgi:hypothetical protein